jgi:excisionase family DNA binding protein
MRPTNGKTEVLPQPQIKFHSVQRSPDFSGTDCRAVIKTPIAPIGALKIKEAAQYLGGVSTITVRRLIKRGLIKPNLALRHILIPVAELDRFLR